MSTIRHEVERLGAEFFRLFKTIVVLAAEIKLEIRIFICRLGQKLPEALFHKAAVCLEHAVPEMGRRDDQTDAGGVLTADDRHRIADGLGSVIYARNDMTVYIR